MNASWVEQGPLMPVTPSSVSISKKTARIAYLPSPRLFE